ncbi:MULTISPECIES: low temperature requirement protein A [unclassified Streptococcus]|uniref:low temperature requirement protein A n=1 Tax=unclassified Streptococcus TaxID=2608887 RepID=UPI0018C9624B|nr:MULTISPECIES: low temperature requirement protein A [unclassified Streptococcus]MBG9367517.1 low temperature requirement protein A [Streptococcus sp. NLN64]MBJ6746326.1 low temperature requirement protein A [Streptococcus sp. 121]
MSSIVQHKRVEFTELFYDLVFVYAISKTTGLIHHLEEGVLPPFHFFSFLTCLLLLVNTWMIQTMFTNRFGKNSLFNMSIMFVDMGLMMLISNYFTLDWQSNFHVFDLIFALLSGTLLLQYAVQFRQSKTQEERELIGAFLKILAVRTIGVLIAGLLPYQYGIWVYFASIMASFLMPIAYRKPMGLIPINFPHLVERISLLVIISFGEMIVGVASFFQADTFGAHSIFFLLIVVLLFLLYFGEFDHVLDESLNTLGMRLIYSHYLIFAGILMITVSMTFLSEHEANHLFVVGFLYSGLFAFLLAIILNGVYNKPAYKWTRSYQITYWSLFGLGLLGSLIFASSPLTVTVITTATIFLIWTHFIRFYMKNHRESNDPHKIYFI